MKLTLFFTLLAVSSTFSRRLGNKREFPRIFADEIQNTDETEWVFNGDWTEEVSGELVAGTEVTIVYDGSRLPGRDTMYGQKAWTIWAQYKFNDGDMQERDLEEPEMIEGKEIFETKIFLPFGTTTFTIWFKHWGYYSGYKYDSNYGKNYEQAVISPEKTTIVFEKDYAENVYGNLEQGGKFEVYYSTGRLEVNEQSELYAVAKYSEDSEDLETHELTNPENGYYVTSFDIPDDAEEVIMWFYTKEGDDYDYDSDYGQNYHFSLSS